MTDLPGLDKMLGMEPDPDTRLEGMRDEK